MAILSIPDTKFTTNDSHQIKDYLAKIGIEYDVWPLIPLPADTSTETILETYSSHIEETKQKGQYATADVINVNANTPGLDGMLVKFNREHWHDEDEVRFVISGRGLFHIHPVSGPVVSIETGPGDMIRIPRGTHHWFDLCNSREIKAIRFFQDKSGWTPHYTGSAIAQDYEPVCLGPFYIPQKTAV